MIKKIALPLAAVILGICLGGSDSIGQVGLIPGANDPSKADLKILTQDGRLLSSTIDPKKGQATFYVVGSDQGYVDINDLKLFMSELTEDRNAVFKMKNKQEDQYAVVPPAKPNQNVEGPSVAKPKKKSKRGRSKSFNLQARVTDKI